MGDKTTRRYRKKPLIKGFRTVPCYNFSGMQVVKGYSPTGLDKESFHIHMGTKDQDSLWDRLYFRDYLRQNSHIAKEYEELKVKLAKIYKHDREAYTQNKTEFISEITNLAKEKKR